MKFNPDGKFYRKGLHNYGKYEENILKEIEYLNNKDIDILVMNSMQSVTESEFDYIKTMQENLEVLKTALN